MNGNPVREQNKKLGFAVSTLYGAGATRIRYFKPSITFVADDSN